MIFELDILVFPFKFCIYILQWDCGFFSFTFVLFVAGLGIKTMLDSI